MSKIERAVFDTNILISAYLWGRTPRRALELVRAGHVDLVSATEAIEEFVWVLAYPKFGFTPEEIRPFVDDLLSMTQLVEPATVNRIVTDPTDNLFLGIAMKGNCKVVVSGDHHLLSLKQFRQIRIITVSEFVLTARR